MRAGWIFGMVFGVWLAGVSFAQGLEDPEGLVIGSIETAGTVTLTRAQVLSTVRARVGQVFRAAQAAEDVKRLASQEGVDTAYYNATVVDGQVVLTYVVVEKNLIRSIVLQGNKKVSDSRLLSELGIKQGDYLDQFLVKSGVEKLQEFYRKKGYSQARVSLDESRLIVGQVIFTIEEGPRTRIGRLVFEGRQAFSEEQLRKVVKLRPKKFLVFPVYWDQEQMKKDEQQLLDFYRQQGYLDIKVESSVSFSEDRKSAEVTYRISEGPAYLVESLVLSGYLFEDEETLRSELKLRPQSPFSPDQLEYDVNKIRGRYRSEGYLDVQVETVRKELEGHRVAVEHRISEGPRYRIGEIIITGHRMIKDSSIRRVLDEEGFTPGVWYDGDAARGDGKGETERIVQQTTAAQSVTIVPSGTEPERRDALVQIAEGQTGTIMLGAGVASDSGLIGQISLDQRNFDITDWPTSFSDLITGKAFRGAGQRFRAMYSPGRRWTSYSVSFTEPYLYDQPLALDLGFYGFTRIRESYDEKRTGPNLGLTRRYSDGWRRGISFRFENVSVEGLESDAPSDVVAVKGDNLRLGTRLWVGLDRTDSRFRPSKGYNFDAGYEQVFGDHTYGLLTATQRWYKTLYEDLAEHKTVLETKVFGGTVVGNAPTYDRFYGGGIGSIRGFRYRGISPRGENDDPIGSDWMAQTSLEVAIPLGSETFSWLVFGDAGLFDSGPIRTSVGVGIQILIPQIFGPVPMRFELGAPITKDDEDNTQAFSFSVGALF